MNSAMNPLRPGRPSDARPAMAKKKVLTGIRLAKPFRTVMSLVWVRS